MFEQARVMLYLWLIMNYWEIRYRAFLCMRYCLSAVFLCHFDKAGHGNYSADYIVKMFLIKN